MLTRRAALLAAGLLLGASATAGPATAALATAGSATVGPATAAGTAASHPPVQPNDPYFSEQWNLVRIGAPAAWAAGTGDGIIIGVVDTGIDLSHADLAGKVLASTNCIGAADDPAACHGSGQDDQGHGTHVSGIAAADTDNGIGVAGVAPSARLVVAKALGPGGSGALGDVNAGIKWVVDHGARIVNLSVEADTNSIEIPPGESLAEGVQYAWDHGAVAVVAAGNATPSLFGGAAAYAAVNAVVVGATGPEDELAHYSSPLGAVKWGLVAPGGDAIGPDGRPSCAGGLGARCIVSTGWFAGHTDSYADDEGTSMAVPEVTGALAVLMGAGQGLTRDAALQRLLARAAAVACGPGCHGRLDLAAAVTPVVPTGPAASAVPALRTSPPATTPPAALSIAGRGTPTGAIAVPAPSPLSLSLAPPLRPPGGAGALVPAPPPREAAGRSSPTLVPGAGAATRHVPLWLVALAVALAIAATAGVTAAAVRRAVRAGGAP